MMRRMRSVLVTAWIGSTNIGDELVFSSLVTKLRARSVDVVAVSLHPDATVRDHDVQAVGHRDAIALTRTLSSVDAVIVGGGGLLQDSTSPFNVPYHVARPVVARLRKRPVGAIGVGAGPLDTRTARSLVRQGMHRVHPITVRDTDSHRVLQRLGIEARTTADLAFGLQPSVEADADRLVACLRPWSGKRHIRPVGIRAAESPEWFVDTAARALDEAATAIGLPVHFVALQRDRDHALHEAVAARMRAPVTFATPTVHEVVDEIGRGAVVVSMRYHGVVCAALSGRPTVAIGYSPKVDSLVGDLGTSSLLVAWSPAGVASIGTAVREVIGRDTDVVEARGRLRARERGNDDAIDELLARTTDITR